MTFCTLTTASLDLTYTIKKGVRKTLPLVLHVPPLSAEMGTDLFTWERNY
jgi:hypothetical protein